MLINVIGLTGPSGVGKSLLCQLMKEQHVPFIDADKLYHSLLIPNSECTLALINAFGEGILDNTGAPDTKKLSQIVFNSKEKLALLNNIVLDIVVKEIRTIIKSLDKIGEKNVLVDAPTLIESGFNLECDFVVSVLAPKSDRIKRICKRDNISRELAEKRISAQKDDEFYIVNSDFVIQNDGNTDKFREKAFEVLSKILKA